MSEIEILINIAERLGYKIYKEGDDYLEIYPERGYQPIIIRFSSDGEVSDLY